MGAVEVAAGLAGVMAAAMTRSTKTPRIVTAVAQGMMTTAIVWPSTRAPCAGRE